MKTLLTLFVLLFSFQTLSNQVSKLNIGGIYLNDNLFDFFTPNQIRDKTLEDYYAHLKEPNKFSTIVIKNHPSINKKYKIVEVSFKKIDGGLIVHGITGGEIYDDIIFCYKDMIDLSENISKKYPNLVKSGPSTKNHSADSTGNSKFTNIGWFSQEMDLHISVNCTDWSEELTRTKGWTDNLSFVLSTFEVALWRAGL
ncbi:hypothetical protein OAJ30_01170 [Alphaproteobacteria bacterium]|nr:hypothetical protein [Alphaproteobacteria bacterium]